MRLRMIKPREAVRALKRAGFEECRQVGSHLALVQRTTGRIVTVPMHSRDLKRKLVHTIIKQSGLSEEEFRKLL